MTNDKIQNIGGDMIINSVYEIGKSLITNMITTGNGIDNYNNYILNYVNANYYRDINFDSLQELSISRDGFRSIYRNINKGNYKDAFKVALTEMGFNSYADELSEEFVKELPTLIDMSKSSEDIIAELKEENEALKNEIEELKKLLKDGNKEYSNKEFIITPELIETASITVKNKSISYNRSFKNIDSLIEENIVNLWKYTKNNYNELINILKSNYKYGNSSFISENGYMIIFNFNTK